MEFHEIVDFAIDSFAADDAIILYWTTAASMLDDIDILAEWGFISLRPRHPDGKLVRGPDGRPLPAIGSGKYGSHQIWRKRRVGNATGMGRWFLDQHEMLIAARRGDAVPAPLPGTQADSVFDADYVGHSIKPGEEVRAWIDRCFPGLGKIEVFARGKPPPGWVFWGNQAEDTDVLDEEPGELTDPIIIGMDLAEGSDTTVETIVEDGAITSLKEIGPEGSAAAASEAVSASEEITATSGFQAEVGFDDPDEYRSTPDGQRTVPDLVKAGMLVRTSYDTGPYLVVEVNGPFNGGIESEEVEYPDHWSLCCADPDETPNKKTGLIIPKYWLNEIVAVDGRLLKLFVANDDEVFIVPPPEVKRALAQEADPLEIPGFLRRTEEAAT
jgi:N6-adenosine-specific RNA methylase IME4